MPALSQMITWTLLQAPGWDRDGEKGILPLYNEVYNRFLRSEVEQTIQVSGGEIPSLTTVNNQYRYSVPSTIWRVTNIGFSMPYSSDYAQIMLDEYGLGETRQKPDEYFYFGARKYLRFPHVRCFDKSLNRAARIEFTVNPGETTDLFLYIGHTEPSPQLLSESIEPDLPENLHAYLMEGVLKLVEAFQNGNYSEAYLYIDTVLRPKVHAELNLGEQGLSGHVERRDF